MTSLGQVAEVVTAHLGIQAAPRPGRLRLPQTWLFSLPQLAVSLRSPDLVLAAPTALSVLGTAMSPWACEQIAASMA